MKEANKGSRSVVLLILAIVFAVATIVLGALYWTKGAELDEAKSQLASTSAELDKAESQLASTSAELDEAKSQLASTSAELDEAKSQLASTSAELDEAKKTIANLNEIVQLKKQEIIASNQTFNLPAGASKSFTVPVQYAGYVIVDFSATTGVWVTSNQGYSSGEELTSGVLRVPVYPSGTAVAITFSSWAIFTGKTVTATLTYVY